MKRKEEIVSQAVKEQSQLYQPPEWRAGFISGAKWADEHPKEGLINLEDACKWLKENIDLYSDVAFSIKSGYTEITLTDEFETAFRQAMGGE